MSFIARRHRPKARACSAVAKRPIDPALAKGYFVEPTVFTDVTPDMRIAREEIFGPVLAVFRWSDEGDMLGHVNARRIRPDLLDLD